MARHGDREQEELLEQARAKIFGKLGAMLKEQAGGSFTSYRGRELQFAVEILGIYTFDPTHPAYYKQAADSFAAIFDESMDRVAIKGANGVGKTHSVSAPAILTWLVTRKDSRVVSTSTSGHQVRNRLWSKVRYHYNRSSKPLGGRMLLTEWHLGDEWIAEGISTDNVDNFHGAHAEELLIVFNEAQGVNPEVWEGAEAMMTGKGCKWLVEGNPLAAQGDFFETFRQPDIWSLFTLDALQHPNVLTGEELIPGATSRKWVEGRRKAWGEAHPLWQARVRAQFPETADDVLVSLTDLDKAKDIPDEALPQDGKHLGADVARFGSDENVVYLVENRRVTKVWTWRGLDLMKTTGRIIAITKEAMPETMPLDRARAIYPDLSEPWVLSVDEDAETAEVIRWENVHVDATGLGAGVVDRLHEQDYIVDGVNFAEAAGNEWAESYTDGVEFRNRRSELHYVTAQMIKRRELCVPEEFGQLWGELTSIHFEYESDGRFRIEKKEKIKKKTGRSPDHADGLILTASRMGSASLVTT